MLRCLKAEIVWWSQTINCCIHWFSYFGYISMYNKSRKEIYGRCIFHHRPRAIPGIGNVSWYASFTKKQGGICWHSKLAWPKASKVKARITNSILISIILQVWHVWPLCRIWRSFWDILDMISSMRQRSTQNSIKMRSNHEFECTKMKPSSRRSKRIYGSPNLEPGHRRYGTWKFPCLGKSGLTGFGHLSDRF